MGLAKDFHPSNSPAFQRSIWDEWAQAIASRAREAHFASMPALCVTGNTWLAE